MREMLVPIIVAVVMASTWLVNSEQGPGVKSFNVVGYLPEYRLGAIQDWDALAQHLTHLILFSVQIGKDLTSLANTDRLPAPHLLTQIRAATKTHGTKLLVCVGGAGRSAGFSELVADAQKRKKFGKTLANFCEKSDFDGIDFNWEGPSSAQEWKAFGELLKDIRQALSENHVLTLSVHPGQDRYLSQEAIASVDLVHVMAYDQPGQHSTFALAQNIIASLVIPRAKVTLGIPFYGRHIKTGAAETYWDIVQKHGPFKKNKNEVKQYFFNGVSLVKRKTQFSLKEGLAGVMIWELGQDAPLTQPTSLLSAISQTANKISGKSQSSGHRNTVSDDEKEEL